MKEKMEYYLGLDMGTNSVGWAVTDKEYRLMRAKGKDLWGVRLFERANTAEERRAYRINRRRRQREVARIGILKELFADEIAKVDANFFARLDDSKYYLDDRQENNKQKYAIFADKDYTDKEYFSQYPTIFHLRKELIMSDQPHDVRLIYLALLNMFKHRGHFLNKTLGTSESSESFFDMYQRLAVCADEEGIKLPETVDLKKLEQILGARGCSRKATLEHISEIMGINKKNKPVYSLMQMICGLDTKMIDLFGQKIDEEHKKISLSFRTSNYEEMAEEVRNTIGDDAFELILTAKEMHDFGLLAEIMKGYSYLSEARVAVYEEHRKDLAKLKAVFKQYDHKAYDEMFRIMKNGTYSAYVGSVNSFGKIERRTVKTSREELLKNIKKILIGFPEDDATVQEFLGKIDSDTLLQKQLTASNGVIPNQVHAKEMKVILKNAEKYLPFLSERDETGLSVSEKIIALFTFTIPYYVGPLGQQHLGKECAHGWVERKEKGTVYPWNFEQKVDLKASAEHFIERMVKHCTYLSDEQALPKQSLLYEKFQVLNELNNLKIRGEKISVELKQQIYRDVFEHTGKKVSMKQLENYLKLNGLLEKDEKDAVTGIDGGFHSYLSSLGKFIGILGEEAHYDKNQNMMEKIIFWGTVYGQDKKFLRERLSEVYGDRLSKEQIRRITGMKFEGWGRLSKEFLLLEGAFREEGEIRTLIRSLWETNENLRGLLSERYTYSEEVREKTLECEKSLSEWTIEDLEGMYLSAPVKRMVWQTLLIVKELEKVLGCDPRRIFVEMAREDAEKGRRTESRKQKLQNLYKAIKKEEIDWKREIDEKTEQAFRSKKLYLYYLQKGRCMYTGESIRFEDLMNDNLYDIDHIYPRHFVKDDSLEQNLVLVKKEKNAHKSDVFPIEADIQKKMSPFWKELKERGFISEEKYMRLTRRYGFSEEEKADFINRQLVETRQGTKSITEILGQAFPNVDIIFSKASNVSEFRHIYGLYKVRSINDFHHAHDAYLNIVVGNTYHVKFTKNPLNFIREAEKNPQNAENKYNMNRMFDWTVKRGNETAWIASSDKEAGSIKIVKAILAKNTPLVTKRCAEAHGGITRKATIWNKHKAAGSGYIPVKMNDARLLDVTKYGGLTSVSASGYTLLEYDVKGKKIRSLEAIPIYLGRVSELTNEAILKYFEKVLIEENKGKEITELRICKKFIPRESLVRYNGYYYYLGGKSVEQIVLKNATQMAYSEEETCYIKKIEKAIEKTYYEEVDKNKNVILTKTRNNAMYDKFIIKYQNSIYQNQSGAMKNSIIEKRNEFLTLSLEKQCRILKALVEYFRTGDIIDLRELGGSSQAGKVAMNKKIMGASELVLISQSPTGLFQQEIDLLKI